MATALSRSPLYVRGGHLHALDKLLVAHSGDVTEDIRGWGLLRPDGGLSRDAWRLRVFWSV